ncbi:hypothetical protein PAXINDRAFT_11230 [Paxillus involutus ATCC 200175]|nr:hypothetical protein PAXINDRAFT_11230 [Paxillus involutus ATCC 200175]
MPDLSLPSIRGNIPSVTTNICKASNKRKKASVDTGRHAPSGMGSAQLKRRKVVVNTQESSTITSESTAPDALMGWGK